MIPMLLIISFIVYYGLQLTGIDPINFMVSPEMLSSNKENVEALRESLGLNDPLIVQYFRWLDIHFFFLLSLVLALVSFLLYVRMVSLIM